MAKKVSTKERTKGRAKGRTKGRSTPKDNGQTRKDYTLTVSRSDDVDVMTVHKSRGIKSGLGVCSFAADLLRVNEDLPKHRRMTDEEMRRIMIEEFSHRLTLARSSIRRLYERRITMGYYRTLYNMGHLIKKKPRKLSHQFDTKGEIIPEARGKGRPSRTVRDLLEEKRWAKKAKT